MTRDSHWLQQANSVLVVVFSLSPAFFLFFFLQDRFSKLYNNHDSTASLPSPAPTALAPFPPK